MVKQKFSCSSKVPFVIVLDYIQKEQKQKTFEENIESNDPFISGDVPVVSRVEIFEDPVQQNVVGHVEAPVEELPEDLPVHPFHLGPLRGVLAMFVISSVGGGVRGGLTTVSLYSLSSLSIS